MLPAPLDISDGRNPTTDATSSICAAEISGPAGQGPRHACCAWWSGEAGPTQWRGHWRSGADCVCFAARGGAAL